MNVEKSKSKLTNVLVVGVGGQGVIMVSKVLALICQSNGYQVKQSEVHGMAKRGGGVFSHVRFGSEVWSPTIPKGEADILLALEWAEGLRWINYLKRDGGLFIADTQKIFPPFAARNRDRGADVGYSPETPKEILELVGDGYALDATSMADELGNLRAANTVLLGVLSMGLDFEPQEWLDVIEQFVPPNSIEINRLAFQQGRDWFAEMQHIPIAERHVEPEALPTKVVPPVHGKVKLEIIDEWCKGCDICVKMCPERCLRLNSEMIAELSKPDACTGCRVCEWLCPDYAIKVGMQPALEVVS
jgi:indolepyruvate ferredoxin oxidoreductase, beta subunit